MIKEPVFKKAKGGFYIPEKSRILHVYRDNGRDWGYCPYCKARTNITANSTGLVRYQCQEDPRHDSYGQYVNHSEALFIM